MAGNVIRAYQLAAQPWVVAVSDSFLGEYLADLVAKGPETSDLKDTENPLLLWAAPLTNGLDDSAGTTFVVSAEVYKRIQSRRYVDGNAGTTDDTADPA
jgi:hypothetical protein